MVRIGFSDKGRKAKQLTLDAQNKTLLSVQTPTTEELMYLSGTGNNFIAVGYSGTILYYDASMDIFEYHSQSGVITTNNLYYIDTTVGDGQTVGEKFTILNYTQSTDTFAASPISGYNTDISLLATLFPYTLWSVLWDIYCGYDTVTGNGVIYIWNGGASPTKAFETAKGRIFSFVSFDWVNYVAAGSGGGIYKSSDYGQTWTTIETNVSDNFTDINGTLDTELWIASQNGNIYRFNSDTDKLTLVKKTGVELTRIWMLDRDDGYVVGSGGTIYHYDGDEWTLLPVGVTAAFNAIFGLEHNKFYLSASGGYIYRFFNMAYPSINIDAKGDVLDYRRYATETIVDALEIRDTNVHDVDTDSEITIGDMSLYNFSSIQIINTLDADITVQVYGNFSNNSTNADTMGAPFIVAASDSETRTIVPSNDGWAPYIYLKITASGVPTTGNVTATIKKKALGG